MLARLIHGFTLNLVLSFGDLSQQTGYRTRVLGELRHLDMQMDPETFLLVFDRYPKKFQKNAPSGVPFRVHARSGVLRFYSQLARLTRKGPIRVVHAHNLYSTALALSARPFYGYKVLLDYHGRIPEEYVYLGKGGEPSRKALEGLERWAVNHSDHIVAVSERLRRYLKDRYKAPDSKFSVVPCCADADTFRWDPSRRDAVRSNMKLDGKLVCTHVGSFFEWYDHELLLNLFAGIQRNVANAHLLVLTSATEKTREYLSRRLPAESFTVMNAPHDEIPPLLNASDVGFLLLRSSPNIETCSPTKFSEYLSCGLPVIITPQVGDFSALVAERGVGVVVTNTGSVDSRFLSKVQTMRTEYARNCIDAGRDLTWQAHLATWRDIYIRRL